MYGVPKYKEPFWLRGKKEIFMMATALVAVTTIIRFSPNNELAQNSPEIVENQFITKQVSSAYKVLFNGKEVGYVERAEQADEVVEKAYTSLKKKLGYDPEIKTEITLEKVENTEVSINHYDVAARMEIALHGMVGTEKKKAYVVKVGNDFTVALPDEASAKEVLRKAQEKFLDNDVVVNVDLKTDPYNSLVTTPKLQVYNPEEERVFVTSANTTEAEEKHNPIEAVSSVVNAVKEKIQDNTPVVVEAESVNSGGIDTSKQENAVEEKKEKADNNEKLLEVSMPKDVLIAESFVEPDKIVDIETATELLTQNKVEEKVYTVEKGDSPSLIAEKNGMGLSKLYELNPNLEEGKAVIHVGDELVVNAPEPLLKVVAKYETVYEQPILKTVIEEKDPSQFVGSSKIKEEGSDGLQKVTAVITKVNGKQVSSQVLDTQVVTEMQPKIRLVGTKPLPPKATTGRFIYPLKNFILSSKYGYRWGSFHAGIDLAAPRGTTIMASDGGSVVQAGWNSGYGYCVTIQHSNGMKTLYGHMSKVSVSVGQRVAQGEKIGEVGSTGYSTGNHCHFEIYINGTRVNPLKYL